MRRLLFLVFAWALGSPDARAETTLELVTGEWPPYVSQSLPQDGVFSQIMRQAFQRAGYQVHITYLSWLQDEAQIRAGKAVAAFPYRPTPERQKEFDFSPPLMRTSSYLFYYKPNMPHPPQAFQSLDDLRGYRIAIQLGYWYLPLFQQHKLNTLLTSDEVNALRQLQKGHLDLAPMALERGLYLIHTTLPAHEKEFGYLPAPLDKETPLSLMFSRSYPQVERIREDFARALEQMEKDGSLKAIYQRNFPEVTPPR
ncbi:substrate-binding periplasmic protein [Chromobacterium alticapitis]|uniref:Solute-binding protein family 3/N-terminal domain-containing protein n=1 Tax=Chromobacterium alticapitis TaxID=2073169 RepID=A0A2S5DCM8_9NEIS|nr:transporter substrate-binding domain-containing protein [Chromobacterium alticapitis]POZ60761.1 hypothetical protein C2I19_17375 [Chromobacterium alticapitis]